MSVEVESKTGDEELIFVKDGPGAVRVTRGFFDGGGDYVETPAGVFAIRDLLIALHALSADTSPTRTSEPPKPHRRARSWWHR